jgi:GT2 family glycosyltransferase
MNNTVWVFIPVHNRAAFTMNCLSTLLEQSVAKQFKIHVIDDGSSDDTAAIIKRDFPTVTIIPGSGNLWWTGAIAKGIETCKEHFKKGDFFLLVNNDAALDANTVETLLYEAVLDRAVAWSPLAIANGSPLACAEAGHTLYHMNLMVSSIQQYQGSIPAKAQFGRCTLYPVEILDVANNFDAKYFPHYWGDTDFAIRAAKHGYHYMVTSKACLRVQHDTQTTGLHFNYFEKPQSIKTVWDCLTLYSSYFNCIHHWRYLKRHDRKGRHMEWFLRTWKVIHQYHVFYYTNKIARKFLGYL